MKPARKVHGASSVVHRIVIGAAMGGIIGVAIGRWLDQEGGRGVASETGFAVTILLFSMSIGTCIGGAFAVVVAEGRSGMRSSQRFRPGAMSSLEGRIALSHFGHSVKAEHAIVAQAAPLPPILSLFPREAAALATGNPVYERWTTTYYDGLSRTDNKTFVLSNNQTVTVTEHITLPGGAGTETVVDRYTAMPSGVFYQNTVTDPNGQIETETRTDTFKPPHKILYNGSIERPDGVTITFTGSSVNHGLRTVVNKSYHESNGISFTTHEVDIRQGDSQASATVTTKWSDGSHQFNKATTTVVMLSSAPS
jgi:hypothetical protein